MNSEQIDAEKMTGTVHRPNTNARPLLIALQILSLVFGLILILEQFQPEWPWGLLSLFLLLVAVESSLTALWLKRPNRFLNSVRFRVAEIIVIVFLLRIFSWIFADSFPDRSGFLQILRHPEAILDGFFVISSLLTLFVILRSHSLTRLFARISVDRSEIPRDIGSRKFSALGEEYSPLQTDRPALLSKYYRDWAVGGGLLIILAALSTFDIGDMAARDSGMQSFRNLARIGLKPGMLAALLVYFLGGFILASEGRFAMLSARWTYEGASIEDRIVGSWRRHSLLVLSIIALAAALIPVGTTVDISGIFQAIGWLFLLIVGIVLAILSAIYYLLLSGLAIFTSSSPSEPLALEEIVPDVPEFGSPANGTASLILGSIFWIILTAVIIFAFIYLIRTRGKPTRSNIFQSVKGLFRWIADQWRSLFRQVSVIAEEIRTRIPRFEKQIAVVPSRWGFIRLSALSAREKIRYFYLSSVKRAGGRGVPRLDGETPSEYIEDLKKKWPEVSEEIDELTQAFIVARYSDHALEEEDAEIVKPVWKRIRNALRRRYDSASGS